MKPDDKPCRRCSQPRSLHEPVNLSDANAPGHDVLLCPSGIYSERIDMPSDVRASVADVGMPVYPADLDGDSRFAVVDVRLTGVIGQTPESAFDKLMFPICTEHQARGYRLLREDNYAVIHQGDQITQRRVVVFERVEPQS